MNVLKIIAFNLGFHSNIVSALEDLKTDEAFVDVSLSCDGHTIQVGHLVLIVVDQQQILWPSSSSWSYPSGSQGDPLGMQSLLQEDLTGQSMSPSCPHPQRHGS